MKYFSQSIRPFSVIGLLALMSLAACSAKVTESNDQTPSANSPLAHKVAGPSIDGKWASRCHLATFIDKQKIVDGSVFIHLDVKGQAVERRTENFSDENCLLPIRTRTDKGNFRYLEAKNENKYIVEYRFDFGDGGISISQETIKYSNGRLWISNFQYSPNIEMQRLDKPATTPGTNGAASICVEREADIKKLGADAQAQLEAALHSAFGGPKVRSTYELRQATRDFKSKYSEVQCDGQTTESFVSHLKRTADEIDQMGR